MDIWLILGGVGLLGFILWFAMNKSKQQGAAEQMAKEQKAAREAEAAIHGVQSEERDTEETKKRMREGKF